MNNLAHFDVVLLKYALGELTPGQMEIFNYFLEKCPCFMRTFSQSTIANEVERYEDFNERRKTGNLTDEEKAFYEVLEEAYRKYLEEEENGESKNFG